MMGGEAEVAKAAQRLLEMGVLGAVCVGLAAFAFYVTRQWAKTNEARVADQQRLSSVTTTLTNEMRETVRELAAAVDRMADAARKHAEAEEHERRAIEELSSAIDSVVRDAVRAGIRRITPPGGVPRPPSIPRPGGGNR